MGFQKVSKIQPIQLDLTLEALSEEHPGTASMLRNTSAWGRPVSVSAGGCSMK